MSDLLEFVRQEESATLRSGFLPPQEGSRAVFTRSFLQERRHLNTGGRPLPVQLTETLRSFPDSTLQGGNRESSRRKWESQQPGILVDSAVSLQTRNKLETATSRSKPQDRADESMRKLLDLLSIADDI